MKKKTAIIGGFLLLPLLALASFTAWTYVQAQGFQEKIQTLGAGDGLELAHIRLGLGDVEQTSTFPVSSGKMRVNVRNLCNDTLLDLGTIEYHVGQLPVWKNQTELSWFAPEDAGRDTPLFQFRGHKTDGAQVYELQPGNWLSTLSINPIIRVSTDAQGTSFRASADVLKLPAVTGDPSDFVVRNLQLALSVPQADATNTKFEAKADLIGFQTKNIQNLDVLASGEVEDGERVRWRADIKTGALMYDSLLLDSTEGQHAWVLGDAAALQFLLKSSVQSCGGYATAPSHEFNVRAALSKLVTAGLQFKSQTRLQLLGQQVSWALNTEFDPQNDSKSGFLDLGRSLRIHTEFAMPFDKMGARQQELFLASGFFKEDEVRRDYKRTHKASLTSTLETLRQAPKGSRAQEAGRTLAGLLRDTEQALYLRDFTFASSSQSIPRVAFEGLKGVEVDSDGTVKMRVRAP